MQISLNETEVEELEKALKKRDRFSADRWMFRTTQGRMAGMNDGVYERWSRLAQLWSFPDLEGEVSKVFTALK